MRPNRHVVVVTRGQVDTARWRRAVDQTLTSAAPGDSYTWHVFDCLPPTSSVFGHMVQRIRERRHQCAERLEAFLRAAPFFGARAIEDPEITLIGRGYTCNVVRQFVIDRLVPNEETSPAELGDVRSIRRFRQLVLINPQSTRIVLWTLLGAIVFVAAGPIAEFLGAWKVRGPGAEAPVVWLAVRAIALAVAGVLGLIFVVISTEEIQRKLGIRSTFDSSVAARFRDAVEERASKKRPLSWPIPTRTLRVRGLPEQARSLSKIAAVVRRPPGHANLYDVELFERRFVIATVDLATVPPALRQLARDQGRDSVFADNQARYRASVAFSAFNSRAPTTILDDWVLRYGTSRGLVDVTPVHKDNLWEPAYVTVYERDRKLYEYHFRPGASEVHELELTAYGGYGESERRSHTHLRTDAYYWRVRETLDLSEYLRAGFFIPKPPVVSFRQGLLPRVATSDPHELRVLSGLKCDCAAMDPQQYEAVDVPVAQVGDGVYCWDVEGIRDGGVLEFSYVVAKQPVPAQTPRTSQKLV